MNAIEVQTAQNVKIKYEIANVGDRILGAIIDYLVITGFIVAMILGIEADGGRIRCYGGHDSRATSGSDRH